MVRICLAAFFILMILMVVSFLLLNSSEMTAEEAATAFALLKQKDSREQIEGLLGEPFYVSADMDGKTIVIWQLTTERIQYFDLFWCNVICDQNGKVQRIQSNKIHADGWEAWSLRWVVLKGKMGFK
jgi:hypothetical protein